MVFTPAKLACLVFLSGFGTAAAQTYPPVGTTFTYQVTAVETLADGSPRQIAQDLEKIQILAVKDRVIYYTVCRQSQPICAVMQSDLIYGQTFEVVTPGRDDPKRLIEAAHQHYLETIPHDPGAIFPLRSGKTIEWRKSILRRATVALRCCAPRASWGDEPLWILSILARDGNGSIRESEQLYDPSLGWIVSETTRTTSEDLSAVTTKSRLVDVVPPA